MLVRLEENVFVVPSKHKTMLRDDGVEGGNLIRVLSDEGRAETWDAISALTQRGLQRAQVW